MTENIRKALHRAFSLGQTYWQQADSDSYKQNAKSEDTRAKFDALVEETCATLPAAAACAEQGEAVKCEMSDEQAEALRVLAEFAKTAPGRLPQRVQDAIDAALSAAPAPSAPADQPSPDKQGQQGEARAPDDKITIRYERSGRCFWHIGCKAQRHSPPMRILDFKEPQRTALRCVACKEGGWFPDGGVGDVCCERIASPAPTEEPRTDGGEGTFADKTGTFADKRGTFADPERMRAWEEAGRRIQAEDAGLPVRASPASATEEPIAPGDANNG